MDQIVMIKNMVCPRCIQSVKHIFDDLQIKRNEVQLGKVTVNEVISPSKKKLLKKQLLESGFELLESKQTQLVNQVKAIIIDQVHYNNEPLEINFSTFLTEKLNYDYTYLSKLFSSEEGRTIERFILSQKIEKVKELLTYGEKTLSEIAFEMGYSSSAHLSTQFKKITAMSPSQFRKERDQHRQMLDNI